MTARKGHQPEEIVAKLRQVDVLVWQGQSVADAVRSTGVSEVTCYSVGGRSSAGSRPGGGGGGGGRRGRGEGRRGRGEGRELLARHRWPSRAGAAARQPCPSARLARLPGGAGPRRCDRARLRLVPTGLAACSGDGLQAAHAPTITPDHLLGAGHDGERRAVRAYLERELRCFKPYVRTLMQGRQLLAECWRSTRASTRTGQSGPVRKCS